MGLEVVDRPYAGDAEPAGFAEETSNPQQLFAGVHGTRHEMTRSGSTIAPDRFRPVKVHGVDPPAVRPQPGHTDLDRVGGCNPAACQGLVQQPEVRMAEPRHAGIDGDVQVPAAPGAERIFDRYCQRRLDHAALLPSGE